MLFTLLQAGYYAEPASGAAHYSAATMGMFVLIIVIGIAGYAVQARLQSVFRKYSKVQFPGGLTGAEVAEKMLRDNNIHNVKVTHVGGNLTDHFNPQTMTVNLSDSVYSSTSVAAAAVAAHECGHAVQHPRTGDPRHDAERAAVLDRRGADRHVGGLLAGDAARRIQRLGTRAGMAAGQPHDAGRTARASPGSPLMGSAHLPRSSSQRHRLGALLRLPDPRATRLNGR